jgi:hypothetical protein
MGCRAPLGRNQVLEAFPVGRRLAFDPAQGRLWALCPSCRQWNLAPLEERWEAVEGAERLFEGAALGAGTEHVGLGRVADGTELLRIGGAKRPEVAMWRYGDRLLGRWRRHRRKVQLALGAGAVTGMVPVIGSGVVWAGVLAASGVILLRERRVVMRTSEGELVRRSDGDRALLVPGSRADAWEVLVPRRGGEALSLSGDEGLMALRRLLPRANLTGGSPDEIRNATEESLKVGSPENVLALAARELGDPSGMNPRELCWRRQPHRIASGHPVLRLAVEMAANDETERRALEGELALLEREWREAEELAAISDDLLFPSSLRARLEEWKRPGQDPG